MTAPTLSDAPRVFAEVRSELIDFARSLDENQSGTKVPICPAWSVKDVYAHVVGINADFVSGNLAGIGTEAWTAAQVDQRTDQSLGQICDEWEQLRPQVDATMADKPGIALRAGADLAAHRLDVFSTLGHEAPRSGPSTKLALVRYGPEVMQRIADAGLPVLAFTVGDQRWVSGDGEAAVSLTTTPFELFRVLTGRRSAAQVVALPWSGDPRPYVDLFSPYGVAAEALIE